MNRPLVDPIANTVLYEGYILYPYRPSTKNRPRWTFGGLYPERYCQPGSDDASMQQTECLVVGHPGTLIEVVVRFLHLTARQVVAVDTPLPRWPGYVPPMSHAVESLRVGETLYQSWQEAEEREVGLGPVPLKELLHPCGIRKPFTFTGGVRSEPLVDADGRIVGALARDQETISGVVEVFAIDLGDGLYRLTARTTNLSPLDGILASRDEARMRSLTSTHAILGVNGGEFISLMDPPDCWREAAAACRNIGTWPVLVGPQGRAEMMLSASLILYDYPQLTPENLGDLFDDTGIDEILTLRMKTLTDDKPHPMTAADAAAGAMLARTEAIDREPPMGLHETFRGLPPMSESGGESHG